MNFNIRGDKVKVTEAIKNYAEEKISRINKYFHDHETMTANVLIRVKGIDQTVEVTINNDKMLLRAEESHRDLYAAIDLVVDKLERQIRKNKTRMTKKSVKDNYYEFNTSSIDALKEENKIVKRKKVEMKPMSEDEAILQMNLTDHEFFVYKNIETDKICVLYRRKDSNYGVIETN